MKAFAMTIFAFEIAVVTGGCISSNNTLIPVTDPNVESNFLGFSIEPPVGQGWFVQEQGSNWITYIKRTGLNSKHTVTATAISQPVDLPLRSRKELREHVKRMEEIVKTYSKYGTTNQRISALRIDRAECIRVDFTAQDYGIFFVLGPPYIVKGFDINCLHPSSSHMVIRFGVSQRFRKGEIPLALETETEPFIAGISFDEQIINRFSIGALMGVYAYDKYIFFPDGRNRSIESVFLTALKEGGCEKAEVYSASSTREDMLPIEYDGEWAFNSVIGARPDLGCLLGRLGRWKEALDAFRAASIDSNPQSAETMGNVGVAAHVAGRFQESTEYFKKAKTLEPGYFTKKIKQKKIFRASEKGASVFGE